MAGGLALLLVGFLGVAATALAGASALRLSSFTSTLLAAYLLGTGEVIALTELLSLVRGVGRWEYLGGEAVLLAAATWAWRRRGSPRPALPRLTFLRDNRIVLALGAAVALAVLYEAFLVLTTPPNNWDSLAYHLPRAAEWLQRGAVEYVPNAHTERMNSFQPNAEMEVLWTMALAHWDTLVELPQFLAQLALLLGVFGIARRTGASQAAALFAALLTATLSEVALESVTTQNDLVVAAFAVAAAYFLLGGEAWLAALAVGLALGTKLTVVLAAPALVVLVVFARRRLPLARLAVATVVCFAAVGAYGYVLNLVETGKPLGDARENTALQPHRTASGTVSTIARVGFRFVDLSGYHRFPDSVLGRVDTGAHKVFEELHIPANPAASTLQPFTFFVRTAADEDVSYFGPLGFLLVLPLVVAFLVRRRPNPLALALPTYLVLIALAYRYNDWIGRFMITPVALTMPLAAVLYRWRALAAAIASVGVLTLALSLAYDHTKPTGLEETTAVWKLGRADAMAVTFPPMRQTLEWLDKAVPQTDAVDLVIGEDDWQYPFYGPRLTRRVRAFRPPARGPLWPPLFAEAARDGVRWIVVNGAVPVPPLAGGWREASRFSDNGWYVLRRP